MARNVSTVTYQVRTHETWGSTLIASSQNVVSDKTVTVLRPDVIKTVPFMGFRKPTGWVVSHTDHQHGFLGTIRYNHGPYYDGRDGFTVMYPTTSGSFGLGVPPASFSSENTVNRAVVKALVKLKNQKVNVANAIAESRSTVSMVADRLTRLSKAVRAVKHGDINGAIRALGHLKGSKHTAVPSGRGTANDWLELQYGWIPLLDDIKGGIEAAQETYRDYGFVIGVVANQPEIQKFSTVIKDDGRTNPGFNVITNGEYRKYNRISLWYRVDSKALKAAASLGFTNPAVVAWELTPWSFMIDWMIPVGQWLDALDATQGTTFLGGTRTQTSRTLRKATLKGDNKRGFGSADAVSSRFEMNRTVYTSSPIPVPFIKNPFSVGHGLNALALLRGLLR